MRLIWLLNLILKNGNVNQASFVQLTQDLMTDGGTHTGGTVLDVLRAKASGNSNFSASVGSSIAERGVSANTYYFRITLSGAIGTFKARWEERLP